MRKLFLLLLVAIGAWGQTQVQQTITINTPSPPAVTGISLNYNGSLGQSEICYWVVATYPRGKVVSGTPACVFTGQPISGGNTVVVKWSAQVGATSYDVLRTITESLPGTCSDCLLGNGVTATTVTDTGASLAGYTLSNVASPVAEFITLNNQDFATSELQIFPYYLNVIGLQFPDGSQQTTAGGGGGAGGPAGGDLGGNYPNPSVLKVNGTSFPAGGALVTNTVPLVTGPSSISYSAVPNTALANSSITVNTSGPLTGGGLVALGSNLTIACATCATNATPLTNLAVIAGAGAGGSQASNGLFDAGLNSIGLPGSLSTGVGSGVTGNVTFGGSTSGVVTVKPQDIAGTWTFKLPITGGTNGFFLQTDGSGASTWAAAGGPPVPSGQVAVGTGTGVGGSPALAMDTSSVGSAFFNGSGLDDLTASGTYTDGAANSGAQFIVQIDTTGTPDKFKWNKNGGSFTSGVSITGGTQVLSNGVTVTFGATTGHTLNDPWIINTAATLSVGLPEPDLSCCNGAANGIAHTLNDAVVDNFVSATEKNAKYLATYYCSNGTKLSPTDIPSGQYCYQAMTMNYRLAEFGGYGYTNFIDYGGMSSDGSGHLGGTTNLISLRGDNGNFNTGIRVDWRSGLLLTLNNSNPDVGFIRSAANVVNVNDGTPTGFGTLNAGNLIDQGLSASLPVQTNGSKQLVSAAIDLSGAQATGVLAAARIPAIIAAAFQSKVATNSTSSIGSTAALTAPTAGTYEVLGYLADGSGAGTSTCLVTIGWTDAVGAKTFSTPALTLAAGATGQVGPLYIEVSSGNITYATTFVNIAGGNYSLILAIRRVS